MSKKLSLHPVCKWFPEMEPEDLEKLAADIKENGQQLPILVWNDQICDGRNRELACEIAGVEPKIRQLKKEPTASEIVALNLHRRHLSLIQRLEVASNLREYYAAEGRERKLENLKQNQPDTENWSIPTNGEATERGSITPFGNGQEKESETATERAATEASVSDKTLKRYDQVKENCVPEIVEGMQQGVVAVSAAAELAKLPKSKQLKAWKAALKANDNAPTAAQVKEACEQVHPPEEKEEPPKWKPKKDKYGTPIPKSLEDSFANDEQFKQSLDLHLPACGKAILELGRAKILKSQVVEVCRNSLAMVATKLKQARPYRVCKDCEGAGCKKCGQHGYFTQPTN